MFKISWKNIANCIVIVGEIDGFFLIFVKRNNVDIADDATENIDGDGLQENDIGIILHFYALGSKSSQSQAIYFAGQKYRSGHGTTFL